jgi:hypothetical protein
MPRQVEIELRGVAASAAGLVASVTPGAAGALTLLVTALVPPSRLMLTVAADEHTKTFAVVGFDRYGNAVTETVTGPAAAGTAYSTYEYQTVTSITVSAATTGAITWGWDNVFYTQWVPLDDYRTPFNVSFGVIVFGTVNYTVQHTRQKYLMSQGARGHNDTRLMVFDHPSVASKTAAAEGNYSFPISAMRVKLNSVTAGDGIFISIDQAWD